MVDYGWARINTDLKTKGTAAEPEQRKGWGGENIQRSTFNAQWAL